MSNPPISEEELALWIEQVHGSSCCSDIAPEMTSPAVDPHDEQAS
ncbi:hypothetical protein [Motilimonas eburnea]|nr:hypothetical protein [Motilimonas eburnea]